MKNGFLVYDSDTHINPAAEMLEKYVDPAFATATAGARAIPSAYQEQAVEGRAICTIIASAQNFTVASWARKRLAKTSVAATQKWMGSKKPRPGSPGQQA